MTMTVTSESGSICKKDGDDEMELTQRLFQPTVPTQGELLETENGTLHVVTKPLSCPSDVSWRTHPIDVFMSRLSQDNVEMKKASKALRMFYKKQDAHIRDLERLTRFELTLPEGEVMESEDLAKVKYKGVSAIIIKTVFAVNLLLLLGKVAASAMSGSLVIISSLLDSCVDLVSGGIMWYASRQMRKRRPYSYPQGRTRLEPVAIIVLAVFMATISLQLIFESIETIVRMASNEKGPPNVTNSALTIMATTVGVKVVLWIVCAKFSHSPAVRAVTVDQRNDVLSNTASLLFSGLASRLAPHLGDKRFEQLKYLDPLGAILIALYIINIWRKIGTEQTRNLAGHTADPLFIQKIAFISLNHHAAIERLDTIRAFHFGCHFLVEVDIVLPMFMPLKEAHDIGEGLQNKLEKVDGVERAFVHLDYEFSHHPETEHKYA